MKKLGDIVPSLYAEALGELQVIGRDDIIEQFPELTFERHTYDETVHSMYIYVGGVRELNQVEKSTIDVKHGECLELKELPGMIILDIDNLNRVMGIEVLDRPDVYAEIRKYANT